MANNNKYYKFYRKEKCKKLKIYIFIVYDLFDIKFLFVKKEVSKIKFFRTLIYLT